MRIQLPGDRAAQEGPRRQRVILEMGEAPIQPGLVTAAVGVRREPGGLIAPRGQVLGQGGIGASSVNFHWELSWNGHWPVKKQLCEGYVHGAGARAQVVPDALPRPPRQVGGGVPRIAVEAQVVGADGVPDDQHDVAGARRRRRQSGHRAVFPDRLPTRREGRQDDQQAEEPRQGVSHLPRVPGHGPRPRR